MTTLHSLTHTKPSFNNEKEERILSNEQSLIIDNALNDLVHILIRH